MSDREKLLELADLFEASSKSLTTIKTMLPTECVEIAAMLRRVAAPSAETPSELVPTREEFGKALDDALWAAHRNGSEGTFRDQSNDAIPKQARVYNMFDALLAATRSASAEGPSEKALRECGIAGIFDTFRDPADAIRQMAQHIKELESRKDAALNGKAATLLNELLDTASTGKERPRSTEGVSLRPEEDATAPASNPAAAPPSVGNTPDQVAASSLPASQQGDDGESTSGSGNPPAREPDADADWLLAFAADLHSIQARAICQRIAARLRASAAPARETTLEEWCKGLTPAEQRVVHDRLARLNCPIAAPTGTPRAVTDEDIATAICTFNFWRADMMPAARDMVRHKDTRAASIRNVLTDFLASRSVEAPGGPSGSVTPTDGETK